MKKSFSFLKKVKILSGRAPGTILQWMYLLKRLEQCPGQTFLEVGTGTGELSHFLLNLGFEGLGFELNPLSCKANEDLNRKFIQKGKYQVLNENFLENGNGKKVDLVISSMVIEHLDEEAEDQYFRKAMEHLELGGYLITFVPASPKHWSVEDDIAGHIRRYSFSEVRKKEAIYSELKLNCLSGLNYPISNWLLPISSFLVKRSERDKLVESQPKRTELSGNRSVVFKTHFPTYLKIILNPILLYPFYFLQRVFVNHGSSLVLYFEFKKVN